jgi:hypothetical protein
MRRVRVPLPLEWPDQGGHRDRLDCLRGSYEAELMTSGPRSKYRQLPLSILAAVCALVALAGCGGSANSLHTVRSAATKTLGLTAQSTLTVTGAQLFGGTPGPILGRAQYSFPRGLGYEALQVPALGPRASGMAYLVFLPQQLWSKPVVSSGLPEGHLWISATFTDVRPAAPRPPALALALESLNPQLLLEEIATGAVAASSSGQRVVYHLPFAEYVVSVDLARAIAAAKAGALRTAMQEELSALRADRGTHTGSLVRIMAGVDGAGRIVHLQASLPGSKLGTVQIALVKFGSTIPLSLPLPSETEDITSLRRAHGAATARWVFTGE